MNQLNFTALGTSWIIESSSGISPQIPDRLARFEQKYSRFIDTSFLNLISSKAGTYPLDEDGYKILKTYSQLYKLTSGIFTPLIGQNLVESGYDSTYSLVSKTLRPLPKFDEVVNFNDTEVTILRSCQFDFGGVGKGYAIDLVKTLLESEHPDYFYINAGGDIYVHSKTSVEIALENPNDTSEAIGISNIINQSICASSGNRRKWGKFHHIINPNTLSSPSDVVASWVVADTTLVADTLATCLFLVPPAILQTEFNFEFLVLDPHLQITKSLNFPAKLFS